MTNLIKFIFPLLNKKELKYNNGDSWEILNVSYSGSYNLNGGKEVNKTKKVMTGISSTALMLGLAGCGSGSPDPYAAVDLPPVPDDQNCMDWEWDLDDGVWECEDSNSGHYGHYYYGGKYYSSKPLLYKSKSYSSYKNSSTFKGISSTGTSKSSSKVSSGFGSGSKSYGG